MSIVTGANKEIKAILKMFGVDPNFVKEAHIHIVANEAVIIDIVKYADINLSTNTILERYNIVEIPNCEEIEEERKAIEE